MNPTLITTKLDWFHLFIYTISIYIEDCKVFDTNIRYDKKLFNAFWTLYTMQEPLDLHETCSQYQYVFE